MKFKYAHVFMVADVHCKCCEQVTAHFFAVASNNKTMKNCTRIKQCEQCNTVSEAPIQEGI